MNQITSNGFSLISLVIPTHNEQDNIAMVIKQARHVLPQLAKDYEIILVDDGSTDTTVAIAQQTMGENKLEQLRLVKHQQKQGYGIAVKDGLKAAQGDLVAFVDGDGQFDLADLQHLSTHIGSADLVTGYRLHRADHWSRSVVSGTFNVLVRLFYGLRWRDVDCGMKLMRGSLLAAVSPLQARSALLNTELYFKAGICGAKIVQVGIEHHPRKAGVRSGGRLVPIIKACRDLIILRIQIARHWQPPAEMTSPM